MDTWRNSGDDNIYIYDEFIYYFKLPLFGQKCLLMVPPGFVMILLLIFHNYFYAVYAFSFWFRSLPTQCENLTIEWIGGTAPFILLLVPTGHITPETRTIIERHISSGNSISLTVNYPSQSQFVAVLSDAKGIGTGGMRIQIILVNNST